MTSAPAFVENKLRQRSVILFSKTVCAECDRVKSLLNSIRVLSPDMYEVIEIDKRGDCSQVQDFLWGWTDLCSKTVPLLFVNGVYFGGYDRIFGLFQEKRLKKELTAKLHEMKIKAEKLAASQREEVVVKFQELDSTEICVEIHELDLGVELDDGEYNCPHITWGFDPWEFDPLDFDVVAAARAILETSGTLHMCHETNELKAMRSTIISKHATDSRYKSTSSTK